jgi:hypothetical protein
LNTALQLLQMHLRCSASTRRLQPRPLQQPLVSREDLLLLVLLLMGSLHLLSLSVVALPVLQLLRVAQMEQTERV